MRLIRAVAGVLALVLVLAGCGANGGPATISASPATPATPPTTTAPTAAPASTAASAPTTAPTRTPTFAPPAAGPVVLASTLYPYRLTVPSGPTSFVPAPVPWDGVQKLSSDTRMADRARTPGVGLVWLAMTDTTKDVEAVARDIEAKFRHWHGCAAAMARREFAVGNLKGVAFAHLCAGGEPFVRAVVVGQGHALVAFSAGGPDTSGQLGRLIELFGGLEWTG